MQPNERDREKARELAEGLHELLCVEPIMPSQKALDVATRRIAAALAEERERCAVECDHHKGACLMARDECDRSTAEGMLAWCCHDRAAKVAEHAAAAIRAGSKPALPPTEETKP